MGVQGQPEIVGLLGTTPYLVIHPILLRLLAVAVAEEETQISAVLMEGLEGAAVLPQYLLR